MKPVESMLAVGGMLLSLSAAWASPVNINQADARTIAESLNGIGIRKAEAIVDFRLANGPFKSIQELARVKGLGLRLLDKNREDIQFK